MDKKNQNKDWYLYVYFNHKNQIWIIKTKVRRLLNLGVFFTTFFTQIRFFKNIEFLFNQAKFFNRKFVYLIKKNLI